ncbi:acetyl esterase [Nakamurella panacisegetis]|uniref:Acetyl esterase n=1 Tax=Nakamurella panacisegetis TaxID=1090615 RepID=A0A1H0M0H2_9ACTN|nr:alpha/beta hydrolase [Nakamurella panacisegetis]SDO73969.1 acetyl esterase [Nakamurella panacisegetis]
MVLDDAVRKFLDTKLDSGDPGQPVADRRQIIRAGSDDLFGAFGAAGSQAVRVSDHVIDADGSVRARVYQPSEPGRHPLHVFLHGGAWWLGAVDELVNDALCRDRCQASGCVVVSVEYRLAPEFRYPTAVEDSYAALVWAVDHAEELGADPDDVSVGGISSGANLAAAVALLVRDRHGPRLVGQLLEVPPLDLTLDTMRGTGISDEYGISAADLEIAIALYLNDPAEALDPLASPLLADDLSGLAPVHVMTAEFDPLRADGERFVARVREAGGEASIVNYPGAVHGSLALTGVWAPARRWQSDAADALRTLHAVRAG